jgi:hypothetical protein
MKGSGDQQTFQVFLEHDTGDVMVSLQDSMILNTALVGLNEHTGIQFLWHFTNHVVHWDRIYEPINEFNRVHNIVTHTDYIHHELDRLYGQYPAFRDWAHQMLNQKEKWCGCFGGCCIVDRATLLHMKSIINFVNIFSQSTTNRQRRANESILALICYYIFPNVNFCNSYDGLYYDGYTVNKYNNNDTGFDNLVWCCRNTYISKISFCR